MSEAAPLLAVLRRIRRRVRFWAAVEGAAAGAAFGLLAASGLLLVARHNETATGLIRPLLVGLACAAAGAVWRATRRVSLSSCARFADAALGREGEDRILSAFCLRDEVASPFVRALVADATAYARRVAPSGAVPARRPRALPVLGLGAIALVVAAMVPVRSRAARPPSPPPAIAAIPLPMGALDGERDEARRAALAAEALGDERVAALASELDRALRRLAAGELNDGEAIDLMKAIEARAAEATRAAERDRRALAATEQALAGEKSTRAAGEALAKVEKNDPGAAERARAALGTSAADRPTETGRALAAAARGVSQALGGSQSPGAPEGSKSGERRLTRDQPNLAPPRAGAEDTNREDERRLERLQRDLDQTSGACRDGSANCRAEAENRARDLSRLAERSAGRETLQRLERAARQLRGRIGRGELRDSGNEATALRRFQREAGGRQGREGQAGDGREQGEGEGQRPQEGQARGNGTSGDQPGDGDKAGGNATRSVAGMTDQPGSGDGEGQSSMQTQQREQRTGESVAGGGGDGIGNEAGGEPLGKRGALDSRGHQSEAEVRNGAGPSRAEVINGAARKGFVTRGYAQVFEDYEAAVEDALGATAVPEGKRYIVRRYFDLIRPRATGGKGR